MTSRRLFAFLGELPAKGLPPVVDILHKAFATRRSVCAMPRVDHTTHLEGIYPPYYQTRPYERAGKTTGADHRELSCRGLTFVPTDCADWLLNIEEDGPLNVLSASKGLFP